MSDAEVNLIRHPTLGWFLRADCHACSYSKLIPATGSEEGTMGELLDYASTAITAAHPAHHESTDPQ